jgi:DNA-binding GntR family transcriptional regulator
MRERAGDPGQPASALSGRARAYEFLHAHVLTDPDQQGAFLNEQELAERTPVREALLLLAADDLVEMIPKRGARIPVITGREIAELMELRGVLERHAATRAVEHDRTPLDEMRAVLEQQRAMVATPPRESGREFIEHDRRFHQLLIDAAGSELMSRTYAKLRARQILVGVEALYRATDRQDRVCEEHAGIVDALAAGDAEAARDAIDRHLAVTLDVLLRA